MDVRRLNQPRGDEGIHTLDNELRALEAHHGRRRKLRDDSVRRGGERQGERLGLQLHLGTRRCLIQTDWVGSGGES